MTDFNSPQLALGALAWMLTYLLHSTILIGGIWCVLRLRLIRSAAVEDVLWKIGLVGALLTATLQAGAGIESVSGTFTLGPDEQQEEPSERPIVDADIALGLLSLDGAPDIRFAFREAPVPRTRRLDVAPFVARDPLLIRAIRDPDRTPAGRPAVRLATTHAQPIVPPVSSPVVLAAGIGESPDHLVPVASGWQAPVVADSFRSGWLGRNWIPVAASLWALLAAVGLSRFLYLRRRLLRALGTRKPVVSVRMLSILGRLEHRSGIRGVVRLTYSPFLSGPVALGRREICVPSRAVTDLEAQQQEALLAHELAHIRRRDPQWLSLCAVLEAVFFFQPLNRLARTRLQAVSEFLCDDWAVDSTGRRVTLAQCLAEVASWIEDTREVLPVASMARPDSSLVQRIRRIADRPPRQQVLRRSATTLLAMAMLGVVSCGVPGISSGFSGSSMLEQLQAFVRGAYHSLSVTDVGEGDGDSCCDESEAPAAPAADCPEAAPEPTTTPKAVDTLVGGDEPHLFRRRLKPPVAPSAPLAWPMPAPAAAPVPATAPLPAATPLTWPMPMPAPSVWPRPATRPSPPTPAAAPTAPMWPSQESRPATRKAPVYVRRLMPPVTPGRYPLFDPTEPLVPFQQALPEPVQPRSAATFSTRSVRMVRSDEGDETITLRVIDGEVVGVDASGRTFKIVGVDRPGSEGTTRLELDDGQLRVVDGDGETIVVLTLDDATRGAGGRQRRPQGERARAVRRQQLRGDVSDRETLERQMDREIRDIERDYQQEMKEIDRALNEVQRSFDRAQRDLSRDYEDATQQGQREYDSAMKEWTREFEYGSKELSRDYEEILGEFEREFEVLHRELAADPDALENLIDDWEERQTEWTDDWEDEWEIWESVLEEELESLEDEYEQWWEVVEDDFEQAFEELEFEFESGMEEWEYDIEALEDEYETAFADWEDLFEDMVDEWDLRDCDHDCETECANGCTHPEEQSEPDCDDEDDDPDRADQADEDVLVEAGVN